jgi:hypothetical protein
MEKMKLSLFDFFGYLIPGLVVYIGLNILVDPNDYLENVYTYVGRMTLGQAIFLTIIFFILGFFTQYLAYEIFKFLGKLIWKKRIEGKETSIGKLENKIVKIRHHSPENYSVLKTWLAYRAMSYSLFLSVTFMDLILIVRSILSNNYSLNRIMIILISAGVAILSLRRSITFHEWTHNTIDCTIKELNLNK